MKTLTEIEFEILINKMYGYLKERIEHNLICPNCYRKVPNKNFILKNSKCRWCNNE